MASDSTASRRRRRGNKLSLFYYKTGGDLSSFTTSGRATNAWYHDVNGVLRVAAAGIIRDAAYLRANNGTWNRVTLTEEAATNLFLRSEPTKAQLGSSTAGVSDAAAKFAALGFGNANGLQFAAAAQADSAFGSATLAATTAYTISAYVIMDDGSLPVVGADATHGDFNLMIDGVIAATGIKVYKITNTLYRCVATATTTGVPGASTGVSRTITSTGKGFAVNALGVELTAIVSSYIQTLGAAVTRNLDQLHANSITFPPQPLTLYFKFVETGAVLESGNSLVIGSTTGAQNPRIGIAVNPGGSYRIKVTDPAGVGTIVTLAAPIPALGDFVELRVVVKGVTPIAYLAQSINGGAENQSANTSGATSYGAAWTVPVLDWTSGSGRFHGTLCAGIAKGEQTMATCRALFPGT